MRRPTAHRSILAMLTVAAVLGVGAPSAPVAAAVPSRHVVVDPRDAAAPADLRTVRILHRMADVVVVLRTQRQLNIGANAAWTSASSASEILIPIDTGGTAAADFRVQLLPSPAGAVPSLVQLPSAERCVPFLDQPTRFKIRLRFERDCIDSPDHLRLFVRYRYDRGGDGTVDSNDRARNTGWTPPISHA
jgi:hypothetical protein